MAPTRDDLPARWSDGVPITAHDVVYSWRRYVSPETGFSSAYYFYYVSRAEEINSGKASPEDLGIRVLDDFAFQVDLRAPAPDFLSLCCIAATLPMPMHAIELARKRGNENAWIEPGRMVSSGPFVLSRYRAREHTVVTKNRSYFDAGLVGVDEIEFLAADGATVLNLFRAGMADAMEGRVLPVQLAGGLRKSPALHLKPAFANHNWRINAKRPPLDNVQLRYALNMATDKASTVRYLNTGQAVAKGRVPALDGYRPPRQLTVEVNGRQCDVLAYDPRAARELWAAQAPYGLIQIHHFGLFDSRLLAEILQQQWHDNLGVQTVLAPHEPAVHIQTNLADGNFSGVADDPYSAFYQDPYDLLGVYTAPYPNWSDPHFDRSLAAATSIADSRTRMERLAKCEEMLLRAMPFVPLYFDSWVYLERPEVRGLSLNPLGIPSFKYAWIDAARRPAA
jgi:ABC-type oligopeptide transport system substrate-binding subunit